jgi:hypothetical protein
MPVDHPHPAHVPAVGSHRRKLGMAFGFLIMLAVLLVSQHFVGTP